MSMKEGRTSMKKTNVISLLEESGERYLFLFDDNSRLELVETLAEFAADDDLSFDYMDAVRLSMESRRLMDEVKHER